MDCIYDTQDSRPIIFHPTHVQQMHRMCLEKYVLRLVSINSIDRPRTICLVRGSAAIPLAWRIDTLSNTLVRVSYLRLEI